MLHKPPINFAIGAGLSNVDQCADIFTIGPKSLTGYLALSDGLRGLTRKNLMVSMIVYVTADYHDWQIQVVDLDSDGLNDILACMASRVLIGGWRQYSEVSFQQIPQDLRAVNKMSLHWEMSTKMALLIWLFIRMETMRRVPTSQNAQHANVVLQ